MEKIPNKYALVIRIVCYILIPICILAIIQSAISMVVFAKEDEKIGTNNYFETEQYADLYRQSIYNNVEDCYSYIQEDGSEIRLTNRYGTSIAIEEQAGIYYKNYLENKNFKFLIIDNKTNTVFTNLKCTMRTDTIEKIKQELNGYTYYWNYTKGNIDTNMQKLTLENMKYEFPYTILEENYDVTIYTAMKAPLEYYDDYYDSYLLYKFANHSHETAFINLPLAFIIILVCMGIVGIYTGRKKGEKEVYLNWFDKIPLEVAGMVLLILFFISIFWCIELLNINNVIGLVVFIMLMGICYIMGMIAYETFIRRIKSHTLWKNTLLYRLYKATVRGVKNIYYNFSLAVKIIIAIITFILLTCIFISWGLIGFLFLLGMCVLIFKYTFTRLKQFFKIKDIVKELYEGNTQIRLQEEEYEGVLKELSIYVNDIAGGFTNAIEKSLKSERMKTELITNVSHDIKTPLTSIINYVDLLKKEEIQNEKAKEYLEILDQKSQRLKRLTEDLVEASKASSGNIKLNMERLDVKELMKQVSRRI